MCGTILIYSCTYIIEDRMCIKLSSCIRNVKNWCDDVRLRLGETGTIFLYHVELIVQCESSTL